MFEQLGSIGFEAGFKYTQGAAVGNVIIGAGRAWILISGSKMTVQELMGHYGSVTFVRQLAVVHGFTSLIFNSLKVIAEKLGLRNDNSLKVNIYQVVTFAGALTAELLAGSLVKISIFSPIEVFILNFAMGYSVALIIRVVISLLFPDRRAA